MKNGNISLLLLINSMIKYSVLRRFGIIIIAVLLLFSLQEGAASASILDQSNVGVDTLRAEIFGDRQIAQTFTVGVSGLLESIEIDLANYEMDGGTSNPIQDISVGIYSTNSSGLPDQSLASILFDPSVLTKDFTFYSIDFSGYSLNVSNNDVLSIVLSSSEEEDSSALWRGTVNNTYSGGEWYIEGTLPIRLTQKDALGYDSVHVRIPPDTGRVSEAFS